jgi:hypothetical protein
MTAPAPGAPNTGFLANTGESLPLFAAIGGILLVLAIILAIWFRRGRPHARKLRGFLSIVGVVGAAGALIASTTHFASAAASFTLTPQNQTISVAQGSSTTVPTTATLHTTSTAGYTLTLVQAQAANGVSATVKGGDITTDTPVTGSPTSLKTSTTATAAGGDTVNSTLTITASANAAPGTSALKLTYTLTETPVPADPTVCENANPVSACQVDMDAALIPVTYTGTTSTPQWSKADVSSEGNWYNYQAKQWANAVAVTGATRTTYQNAAAGTVIPESDVLGYYTYIPRYEYQVCRPNASDPISGIAASGCPSDVSAPYDFNIKFQTASQTTTYNGTTIGGWATHPAFSFGSTQLNGIWVGKYQTSTTHLTNSASYGAAAEADRAASVAAGNAYIKPNQYGLQWQTVSNQFATAQSFADNTKATYQGMNAGTTDSRMMTNGDWGAVTYLTTSSYGKGAASPVDINNCYNQPANWWDSDYNGRTGWSGGSSSASGTTSCAVGTDDSGAYQTTQGQGASTTGNTSGIYDMVGGNWQYVMAHLANDNPSFAGIYSDNSGFSTLPASKYYDNYSGTIFTDTSGNEIDNVNHCTWATCGGQAWSETTSVSPVTSNNQSWLGEASYSVDPYYPWVFRGGNSSLGSYAGLFSALTYDGSADVLYGFRVVQSRF